MPAHRIVRAIAAVALVALCAGTMAGCSDMTIEGAEVETPPPPPTPQPGGRLVYGIETDPNGLDPTRNAWDPAGIQLANALYDPLATVDAEGRVVPYLAESFTPNADFTTWTVKLRPGVLFSDGTPFDSTALAEFFNALKASLITGPPAQLLMSVQATDSLTLRATMARPWASLPALLAGQGGYVVSPKQLKDPEGHSKPVGTGPFVLRDWEINKKFELVKNTRYWRANLPYLEAVDFVVVRDAKLRIDMLARGELDIASMSAPWENRRLADVAASTSGAGRLKVERDGGDAEKAAVAFNTTKPPLNDVRVRQAIAHATDIQAIASRNQWPVDRLARGPFDPASPFFADVPYPNFDLAKAKDLVRQYLSDPSVRNRPRTITFRLLAPDDGTELVDQLVSQWGLAGIEAKVEYVELKDMVRMAVVGEYEAANLRYFAAADPDQLWHFFVGDTIGPLISLNFTRLANKDITDGMNEGRATSDEARRKQGYAKVQQTLATQVPYIWLVRFEWRVASTARVHDAHNVTLPDGKPAMPLISGTHRLTETWVDR